MERMGKTARLARLCQRAKAVSTRDTERVTGRETGRITRPVVEVRPTSECDGAGVALDNGVGSVEMNEKLFKRLVYSIRDWMWRRAKSWFSLASVVLRGFGVLFDQPM